MTDQEQRDLRQAVRSYLDAEIAPRVAGSERDLEFLWGELRARLELTVTLTERTVTPRDDTETALSADAG